MTKARDEWGGLLGLMNTADESIIEEALTLECIPHLKADRQAESIDGPRVLCVTNIWNERDRIPALFKIIEAQTIHPALWVWIDDGSNDGSSDVIATEASHSPIPIRCFILPPKQEGNIDTIGRAWTIAMREIRGMDFDFLTIFDVDASPDPHYIETMCRVMKANPDVGAAAGQVRQDPPRHHVMGLGKFVRWEVIKNIREYWDISPDSFINYRAMIEGYLVLVLEDFYIDASPSMTFMRSGRYMLGRYAVYCGMSRLCILRNIASHIIHGRLSILWLWLAGVIAELVRTGYRCRLQSVRAVCNSYFSPRKYTRRSSLLDALDGTIYRCD